MALENLGYDEGIVIGRVLEVVNTERADLLILEDRSNPTYPNQIACEFFGERNRGLLQGVQRGAFVRVVGSIRSKPFKGRWYTTYSCFSLAHMDDLRTPAIDEERREPPPRPGPDQDALPF